MKAKQIAQEFIEAVPDIRNKEERERAVIRMIAIFDKDFHQIRKSRNIRFDRALIPIFKELDQKWNSVRCKLKAHYGVSVIVPNGFRIHLQEMYHPAYELYMNSLSQRQ